MIILAMVDRLGAENTVLTAQVDGVVRTLVQTGILSKAAQGELKRAAREQHERSRLSQAAENETGRPSGVPFHRELSQELRALGVLSDNPTVGDGLQANFDELLEVVLERFRMDRGGGDAGKIMKR